jgi:hypothetical protein
MGSDLELQLETARETRMRYLDEVYAAQLGKWGKDQEANRHQQDIWGAGFKGVSSMLGAYASYGGFSGGGVRPEGVEGPSMADGSFYSSRGVMGQSFFRSRRY